MQCNIDSRGKATRLAMGIVLLSVAAVIVAVTLLGLVPPRAGWIAAGMLAVGGGFGIFEARAGWCALRALGVRTPL